MEDTKPVVEVVETVTMSELPPSPVDAPAAPASLSASPVGEAVITFEESSKLSDAQKAALRLIYTKAKEAIEITITSPTVETALKVTMTIATIAKLVESLKVGGKSLPGTTKKLITLELGSMLIKDLIKDESIKANVSALYDMLAESTLETLIDVSNSVNIGNGQTVATACTGCFSFIGKRFKLNNKQ
jgi:hypothetical protein